MRFMTEQPSYIRGGEVKIGSRGYVPFPPSTNAWRKTCSFRNGSEVISVADTEDKLPYLGAGSNRTREAKAMCCLSRGLDGRTETERGEL
jgi:hypothetical protein